MNKTLLIVSGGIEAVPGIRRAKAMGLHVVVSDMNPEAPGFAFADDRIIADTYGALETIAHAREYHEKIRAIDGVLSVASDVPLTVAGVAHELNLPGISLEAAGLASDKMAMKQRFVKEGIAVPWFCEIGSRKDLAKVVSVRDFPLVLKPVDSRGARGVLKLTPDMDLSWAYEHSLSFSPSGRVMVEEYIEGPQISTESVLVNGKAHTVGFADRNYEFLERFAPFMIENGGHQPSFLPGEARKAVSKLAEDAARAMGIGTGIAKGDMVFSKGEPMVIEMAARLSGGWFSTDQIPLATGVDLIGAAIKIALGEHVEEKDLTPSFGRGVAIRYFFSRPGRVVQIKHLQKFEGISWVHKLDFFVKPGDVIESVTDHTKRAGFVITTGESCELAIERAENVVRTIEIETVP